MLSAYKFRLYPEQEKILNNQMKICRELYNRAYHERLEHYEQGHDLCLAAERAA